jgi:hypothetical protein
MSVQEDAQQLISAANEFQQNGLGATNATTSSLEAARQSLAQVNELATESMARAHGLLGQGHAGIGAIGASANAVSGQVQDVQGAIEQAINTLLNLNQAITTHGNTMSQVGHALLQGG